MRRAPCLMTVALALAACGDATLEQPAAEPGAQQPPGKVPDGVDQGVSPAAGGAGGGAAVPPEADPLDQDRDDFCEGIGPLVDLGNGRDVVRETCAGSIAEQVFAQSVCTCRDARTAGYVRTRGFDSRVQGAPGEDDDGEASTGASFGVNGSYLAGVGFTDVGGPFTVAGPQPLEFVGYLKAAGDLRMAPDAVIPGVTRTGRDAYLKGNYTTAVLTVKRDLHHEGLVIAVPDVDGDTTQGPVRVDPPCACEDPYDIAGFVDQARRRNDNALIGLDPDVLKQTVGIHEITLPCGRYYLSEISGVGGIDVHVTGRVALMVDGPVATFGSLDFDLAEGAEIDVFIRGNLGSIGAITFGDEARPAASRVYVASREDVVLVGAAAFVGNLYAPHARVTAPGFLRVFGSLFVGDLDVAGYVNVAYDRSVTALNCPGEEPEPIPGGQGGAGGGGAGGAGGRPDLPESWGDNCDGCGAGSCLNGLGCVDGFCAGCRFDADCCHQQVCQDGRCRNFVE